MSDSDSDSSDEVILSVSRKTKANNGRADPTGINGRARGNPEGAQRADLKGNAKTKETNKDNKNSHTRPHPNEEDISDVSDSSDNEDELDLLKEKVRILQEKERLRKRLEARKNPTGAVEARRSVAAKAQPKEKITKEKITKEKLPDKPASLSSPALTGLDQATTRRVIKANF